MQSTCTVVYAPGELERAMGTFIEVFERHATKDGDRLNLSRRELGNLYRQELNELLQEATMEDPQKMAKIMADVDNNQDGEVNFAEFVSMTTKLIMCTTPYFKKYGERMMCGYI